MAIPRPYRETRRGNKIFREFNRDVDSDELVWHQDRAGRKVTVVKGEGWKLQMQKGLPFPLVEGYTYDIPAKTWHRILRGHTTLQLRIVENDMTVRLTESQLRRIVREEILRESVYDRFHAGSVPAGGTPDPQKVYDAWVDLGGQAGRRVFSYDLAAALDLDDPSQIIYDGTGLMMRNGVVEEMV